MQMYNCGGIQLLAQPGPVLHKLIEMDGARHGSSLVK